MVENTKKIALPQDIGQKPKEAFGLVRELEEARKEIFEKLFEQYFKPVFKGYNGVMYNKVHEILRIGYRKPFRVNLEFCEVGKGYVGQQWAIFGEAFWDIPGNKRREKFQWYDIYQEKDAAAYAQRIKEFFNDLGIEASLIKLED